MKVIVDRFEGDFAVAQLFDKTTVNIPKILVDGAKEGDIISIEIQSEDTKKRKEEINKLMNELF